jgi:hypothetical protein
VVSWRMCGEDGDGGTANSRGEVVGALRMCRVDEMMEGCVLTKVRKHVLNSSARDYQHTNQWSEENDADHV